MKLIIRDDRGSQVAELPAGEVTIGRAADCTVRLDERNVSRQHARLWRDGADVMLEDLGSSNGTFVNGHRITGPVRLREGDQLLIGSFAVEPADWGGPALRSSEHITEPPGAITEPPGPALGPGGQPLFSDGLVDDGAAGRRDRGAAGVGAAGGAAMADGSTVGAAGASSASRDDGATGERREGRRPEGGRRASGPAGQGSPEIAPPERRVRRSRAALIGAAVAALVAVGLLVVRQQQQVAERCESSRAALAGRDWVRAVTRLEEAIASGSDCGFDLGESLAAARRHRAAAEAVESARTKVTEQLWVDAKRLLATALPDADETLRPQLEALELRTRTEGGGRLSSDAAAHLSRRELEEARQKTTQLTELDDRHPWLTTLREVLEHLSGDAALLPAVEGVRLLELGTAATEADDDARARPSLEVALELVSERSDRCRGLKSLGTLASRHDRAEQAIRNLRRYLDECAVESDERTELEASLATLRRSGVDKPASK